MARSFAFASGGRGSFVPGTADRSSYARTSTPRSASALCHWPLPAPISTMGACFAISASAASVHPTHPYRSTNSARLFWPSGTSPHVSAAVSACARAASVANRARARSNAAGSPSFCARAISPRAEAIIGATVLTYVARARSWSRRRATASSSSR